VLVADGSGTPGRGPAWEREVYGDVYGPVLQDQVTAVQEAACLHPDLDPGRVGIRGWSFGGSLAAVLHRPDVFHVAVAGAGIVVLAMPLHRFMDLDPGLLIDQLVGPIYYRILISGAPADRGYAERLVEALLDGAFVSKE